MLATSEPIMAWLRRQRRHVELELDMMAFRYDLDGALAADQYGLAWLARQDLLITAVELHLRGCGVTPPSSVDYPERMCVLLQALTRLDAVRGEQVWQLLETPAPVEGTDLRAAIELTLRYMSDDLAVRAADSRNGAVLAWADATKLLREVAQGLGMAQSDDWYLQGGDGTSQLAWYDEVLSVLGTGSSR